MEDFISLKCLSWTTSASKQVHVCKLAELLVTFYSDWLNCFFTNVFTLHVHTEKMLKKHVMLVSDDIVQWVNKNMLVIL